MESHVIVPSGPGFYAQWPTIVGAPTAWEAVRALDGAYIDTKTPSQRHSFVVGLPPIASDDTLVSAIIRGWLATPVDSGDFADGSFENDTWTLSSVCDFNGALINTDPAFVRSGAKSLQLNSRVFAGLSTCGKAERLVSGLTIGRQYQVRGWFKTNASVTTQQFQVQRDGTGIGSFGFPSVGGFSAFGPASFTATSTSHTVGLNFQVTGNATKTYYIDDLTFGLPSTAGAVQPFYRLYGVNTDLAGWVKPAGQPTFDLQADRPITLLGNELRDGGFEIGVLNRSSGEIQVDHLQLVIGLQPYSQRFGFVGAGQRRR